MGKIYDALKRAEKEAQLNKKNQQVSEVETVSNKNITSEADDNPAQRLPNLQITPRAVTRLKTTQETVIPPKKIHSEVVPSAKKKNGVFPRLNIFKRTRESALHESIAKLYTLDNSHTIVREQYSVLRTRILNFCKEKNMRTILIASSLPGEGKSTVSSNLAVSIANSINEHSLLVDCDLRRPSIHKIFNIKNDLGLSDYLSKDISISQTLSKTQIDKLTIMPAGAPPANSAELISSNKMIDLTSELKTRYQDRFIIFDSTPACSTPEPSIMANYIDCVILVVRAGNTSRELVEQTIESLDKNKILGVVFNMTQEHLKSYSYHKYYYTTQQ